MGPSTGVVSVAGQTLTNVSMVAAGSYHALALKNDGEIVGWGSDDNGEATGSIHSQNTNRIAVLARQAATNIIALSAGNGFSLALRRDGTVLGWGATLKSLYMDKNYHQDNNNHRAQPVELSSLTNVVAIASRDWCGLALKQDGTAVSCWGPGIQPVGLSNVVAIAVSEWDDLALSRDGTVVEWNRAAGTVKQSQGLSNVVALASAGDGPGQCYALKQDGTVATWNSYNEVATNIVGFENVAAIAAGGAGGDAYSSYCLALKHDGTLVIHGVANYQPFFQVTVPEGLSNVVAIAAGPAYCLAITTNWAVAEKFLRK